MEERNDALKNNAKLPLDRYNFAIGVLESDCLTDVGCGMGYGTRMLVDAGFNVVGVDISEEAIEYAKENYPGLHFMIEDANECDYDSPIVMLESLLHLKDPEKFLERIMSKEIVISVPVNTNPDDGYIYRLHNWTEEKFFNEIEKKWKIVGELRQAQDDGVVYITVHGMSYEV